MTFCNEFRLHNLTNDAMLSKHAKQVKWTKPPLGSIKINVDAAWDSCNSDVGILTRDCDGFVLRGKMCLKENMACAIWAKIEAINQGIAWAKGNNLSNFVLESDCVDIINRLLKPREDITIEGHLLLDIKKQLKDFNNCIVNWCPRVCNKSVDRLSKMTLTNNCSISFERLWFSGPFLSKKY